MLRQTLALLGFVLASASLDARAQDCPDAGDERVGPVLEAVSGWSRYDSQTVRLADGRVDHRASARKNWSEVKAEWKRVTSLDAIASSEALADELFILGPILSVVTRPFAVVIDGLDVVIGPPLMLKHLSDGAIHSLLGTRLRTEPLAPASRPTAPR